MKRINRNSILLVLLLCVTVFSVSAAALEETVPDSDMLYEEILEEQPVQEEDVMPAEDITGSTAEAEDTDELLHDDELIIDEAPEIAADDSAAEEGQETETETMTESWTETETETEIRTEAETETEKETEIETEIETETEESLIEEETGEEESTELAVPYSLTINGVIVNNSNRDPFGDGTFYYNGNKVLTICKDVNLVSSGILIDNGINGLEIMVPKGVNAVLHSTGESVIKSTGNLTISGRGSLTLISDSAALYKCYGIYMNNGQLTIEDTSLDVRAYAGIIGNINQNTSLKIARALVEVDGTRAAITDFKDGITIEGSYIASPAGAKIDTNPPMENKSIVDKDGQLLTDVTIRKNEGYPIWVGSTQVTDQNRDDILGDGGKAKYDPATRTLTFNNPTISGSYMWNVYQGMHYNALIFASSMDLTIKGTLNAITDTYNVIYMENGNLMLNGNLTLGFVDGQTNGCILQGEKTLTIQGGTVRILGPKLSDSVEWYERPYGLYWDNDVVMNAGTLELKAARNYTDRVTVNGGTVKSDPCYWYCDYGFRMKNATLSVTDETIGFLLKSNGPISLENSTVYVTDGCIGPGSEISIVRSKVTSVSDGATYLGLESDGDIFITDSTVTAKGYNGIKAKGSVIIENSTVNATGVFSDGILSTGGSSEKIEIKGDSCTVTAEGKSAGMVAPKIVINAYHGITTPADGKLGSAASMQTVFSGSSIAKKVVITWKPADYSKVNAALSKIPLDLSKYTDASVKKVTDAKAAVKTGLPLSKQSAVDAMAAAIENAVKGLVYKGADYSKVEAALKKIPSDLSQYTDASAKAVINAKNAVKYGYNITQQSAVDAMAAAIEKAVKGLVKKPMKVKLIAAYNGAHGVGVKWIKLAGATEYTIWQKYKGVWKAIKTVKPNDSSLQNSGNTLMYTDQTVKTGYGKGYIYSVSAKVGSTVVDYDKAGVAIYRLNPPVLKTAKNSKAGQVVVTWKGVFGRTETNGAYDLQYATEANAKAGKWTNAKKLPGFAHSVTSATITGLKKGTKYVFRIRCSKTNKDRGTFYSEYSPWLSVTVKK